MTRSALVADDSVTARRVVAARLRRDGYEVREAEDGYGAREEIERAIPDLLVVDDVLPALSGVELVQTLRARAAPLPRIAYLVEYPSGARRAALAGLPPGAVIRKPFDLDELSARIAAIVAGP
jgi:two-component system response regulator (stage 0 sporulation protein F)